MIITIYLFLFGFRKNYSTNHTLINLTEDIRKKLDEDKAGCGIFIDPQKSLTQLTIMFHW